MTASVPEIVRLAGEFRAATAVIDGEVIALDASGRPRPFQDTMQRFGRKRDVESLAESVPLSLFSFDCLHAEGEDLIDAPTEARVARLHALAPADAIVPRVVTASADAGRRFLTEALDAGHEGVMAKALDAPYEAGRRGSAWLKVKVAHTLDLVVLAAEWGSGWRRGWLSKSASRRARSGGRFRDARQNFQRPHRRDARVAD